MGLKLKLPFSSSDDDEEDLGLDAEPAGDLEDEESEGESWLEQQLPSAYKLIRKVKGRKRGSRAASRAREAEEDEALPEELRGVFDEAAAEATAPDPDEQPPEEYRPRMLKTVAVGPADAPEDGEGGIPKVVLKGESPPPAPPSAAAAPDALGEADDEDDEDDEDEAEADRRRRGADADLLDIFEEEVQRDAGFANLANELEPVDAHELASLAREVRKKLEKKFAELW